jgi:trans-feruloyl-CoA hydratase/vanillin synthase
MPGRPAWIYGPLLACDLAFAAEEAQFGLSEINWGILPGGGATKIARELLSFRRAMYHSLMGENIDGKTAAEWGLVNEALPLDKLQTRVEAVARILLKKIRSRSRPRKMPFAASAK